MQTEELKLKTCTVISKMNKLLKIFALLILCSTETYSQKKYDIEIYGGPLSSYRTYKSLNYIDPNLNPVYRRGENYFGNVFKPEADQLEKPITAYSAGLKISRYITNKLNLQVGLEYSSMGEKADYGLLPLYKFVEFEGAQIPMQIIGNYHLTMTYHYNYFAIPFSIRYKLCTFKKVEILPFVGLSLDFLNDKKVENTSEETSMKVASKFDSDNHEFNDFSTALSIGLEFNYRISNKLKFFISPNFKQYILPNETVMPALHIIGGETYYFDKINKYNFTYGINTGLRFGGVFTTKQRKNVTPQ